VPGASVLISAAPLSVACLRLNAVTLTKVSVSVSAWTNLRVVIAYRWQSVAGRATFGWPGLSVF
jgi:hypothetical protein